jgi:hypothetical protein
MASYNEVHIPVTAELKTEKDKICFYKLCDIYSQGLIKINIMLYRIYSLIKIENYEALYLTGGGHGQELIRDNKEESLNYLESLMIFIKSIYTREHIAELVYNDGINKNVIDDTEYIKHLTHIILNNHDSQNNKWRRLRYILQCKINENRYKLLSEYENQTEFPLEKIEFYGHDLC